jgi:2',3'-cyclic-nucleotide 2'-phosphodiesterase/3'-nucleotidase
VAIIGITTPSVCAVAEGAGNGALRCLGGVEAAQSAVEEVRQRYHQDLIVAAIHAGLGHSGGNMVTAVADRVPGIDAIVYGHSHQQQAGLRVGNVLLVEPKNGGVSLARLDFDLEKTAAGWKLTGKRSRLIPADKQVAADPEVLSLAKPYHDSAERYLKTPLLESAADLSGALGRVRDNALVDAIHEVQLYYAKADVSFAAMFDPGVRIRKGPVTVREIAALYPYDDELCAVESDGGMVKAALENSARYYLSCRDALCAQGPLINRGVAGFNYDTAQGVTYEIDLTQPAGQRIQNLRWQGRPLLPSQKLRIAINSYRAGGSGGYDAFRNARVLWRSNEDVRDLIVRYFTERHSLPLKPDDNWRVTPEGARRTLQAEVEKR